MEQLKSSNFPTMTEFQHGLLFQLQSLSGAELQAMGEATFTHPDFERLQHVTIDIRGVDFNELTSTDVRLAAFEDAQHIQRNPGLKIAVIASGSVYTGFANIYRAHLEHFSGSKHWPIQLFKDLDSAMLWVNEN